MPGGRSTAMFAASNLTSAPRSRATLARANPHPARGAVADEANAVDRLARAAGGDQQAQTGERTGRGRGRVGGDPVGSCAVQAVSGARECGLARGEQLLGLCQAPEPLLPLRGQPAASRARSRRCRARAASADWPAWRRARTCGCSSRGRQAPDTPRRARSCVNRLSATPPASFAIVLADAGAIRYSSALATSAR